MVRPGRRPSIRRANPTPTEPVALAMADADPAPAVLYLGRPCQYLEAAELAACSPEYWTNSRFAPEVVTAYMAFLDRYKESSGASRLRLFGYSGGGVLATLLAARRTRCRATGHRGGAAGGGGMDGLAQDDAAAGIHRSRRWRCRVRLPPATHFVGGRDTVVPSRAGGDFRRPHRRQAARGAGFRSPVLLVARLATTAGGIAMNRRPVLTMLFLAASSPRRTWRRRR
jgi:hypothetical protein